MDDQSQSVWSRYLSDRESVWRAFREFRDRGDPLTLRFEGVDIVYTATVREVDHRRVTLDCLQPRSGETLMNAGRPFALSGRSDGAYVYSPRNKSQGSVESAEGPAYVMDLPPQLLWQQRRRGPRFPIPASLRGGRARITLTQGGRPIVGAVEDISSSGCRARFDAAAHAVLLQKDAFEGVQVEIAGLLSIQVRIAVRHRLVDPATGEATYGLEFTRVGQEDRLRLEQFLRSLSKRMSNG